MRVAWALLAGIALMGVSFAQNVTVSGTVEVEQHGKKLADRAGAVVWLTPLDRAPQPPPSTQAYQLIQKNKQFEPHMLVVPQGAEVEFPNKDPFFHNVFSLHDGVRFDLGLYERGASKFVRFTRPGPSYIFCNIHPEMSAVVLVMNTRYYAVTGASGAYAIRDVPTGEYQLSIWYERALNDELKSLTRKITVGTTALNIESLVLHQTPGVAEHHKNKYGMDYEAAPSYKTP